MDARVLRQFNKGINMEFLVLFITFVYIKELFSQSENSSLFGIIASLLVFNIYTVYGISIL